MAADAVVDIAAEEHELAVAEEIVVGFGVAQAHHVNRAEGSGGEGDQHVFPETEGFAFEDEAEHVVASSDGGSQSPREGNWLEDDVGINEKKPGCFDLLHGTVQGVIFSGPARGEIGDVQDAHARVAGGEFVHDFAGAVFAAIVDGEKAEIGIVLRESGSEALGDATFLVLCGNDDRCRGWGVRERGDRFGDEHHPPAAGSRADGKKNPENRTGQEVEGEQGKFEGHAIGRNLTGVESKGGGGWKQSTGYSRLRTTTLGPETSRTTISLPAST